MQKYFNSTKYSYRSVKKKSTTANLYEIIFLNTVFCVSITTIVVLLHYLREIYFYMF